MQRLLLTLTIVGAVSTLASSVGADCLQLWLLTTRGEFALCDDKRIVGSFDMPDFGGDPILQVHIHEFLLSPPYSPGPVLYTLPLPVNGVVEVNVGPLSDHEEDMVRGYQSYVDVHTVAHPEGVSIGVIYGPNAVEAIAWSGVKALFR